MSGDRHAKLLTAIAAAAPDVPEHIGLCQAATTLLDVSSAAIVLMSEEESGVLIVASNSDVAAVENLQFVLGEGPCLLAAETGTPVLVPDLSAHLSRWPLFVREAGDMGVTAVFVFPMQMGAITLGVLYLCRSQRGPLSDDHVTDALALAEIAMWLVLEKQAAADPGDIGKGLDIGWTHRAVVHQATGMVAAQLNATLAEALTRLRSFAFSEERPIYDVSTEIVGRRLRLER